jgi:amidase
VRAGEAALAARIQSIFDDVDVVITPGNAAGPSRIGAYQRRGALSSLLLVSARVPYFEIWNLTGQPAATVPWALDRAGVPLSVQLVGRPHDEATVLTLGAQIEAARPWAHRRPPVS